MRAETRVRQLGREAAEEFDAALLHNRVHEQVQGHHGPDDLTRLVELAEDCYGLCNERERRCDGFDDVSNGAFDAGEVLDGQVETVVDEQVARACATIVTDAPGWTDAHGEASIDAAVVEARQWLQAHLDAAERAGVLEEVTARAE